MQGFLFSTATICTMLKTTKRKVIGLRSSLLLTLVLGACAGSAPDFTNRTQDAVSRQSSLTQWLEADSSSDALTRVVAPVCSSTAGHPTQGWAIDAGGWCVVPCPAGAANNDPDRWLLTHDGLRCFATNESPTTLVNTEFTMSQWQLDQQLLFEGFDPSFVANTEWICAEQQYQIDPEKRQGFWVNSPTGEAVYRFYSDGTLAIGRTGGPMQLVGDWGGRQGSVSVNGSDIFRYAVKYGAGRIDDFKSTTEKQVCRFIDNLAPVNATGV